MWPRQAPAPIRFTWGSTDEGRRTTSRIRQIQVHHIGGSGVIRHHCPRFRRRQEWSPYWASVRPVPLQAREALTKALQPERPCKCPALLWRESSAWTRCLGGPGS